MNEAKTEAERAREAEGKHFYALRQIVELQAKVSRLEAWKESALSVMSPYQDIARELNVPLGESVHDKILPGIVALKAKVSRLEQALREIIEMSPKEKPEEKDSTWGNEDDAEYHGFKSAAWLAGEIALAALSGEQPQ